MKKPNEMFRLAGSPTPVWPWSSGTEGVEWYQCPNADTSKVAETGSLAIIKLLLPMCQAWGNSFVDWGSTFQELITRCL